MSRVAVVLALVGCGAPARLPPAGSERDDGHGWLAHASVQYLTPPDAGAAMAGSAAYGGTAYGGAVYGGYVVPAWTIAQPNRTPRYRQRDDLTAAIEGTITWRGPLPAPLATPCGPLAPLRIGPERGVADVLVYIDRVQVGRVLGFDGRPIAVGGTLVKRGCALAPSVQIVTPLPAALVIHGDATPARIRIGTATHALEAAGRIAVQLPEGVTRVDSPDGALAAAWALALDTPYYALTDERGRFHIDQLAPGTYELTIWYALRGAPVVVKRPVIVRGARARLDVVLGL